MLAMAALGIGLCLTGCTAFVDPTDFNRHRYSDITIPRDRIDLFYFDVTTVAEFPADDPQAEAERLKWLSGWMRQRQMCPSGHEVLKKRPFEFIEDNPAHRDVRYEVRCKPGSG
jgi:hypothetical protein